MTPVLLLREVQYVWPQSVNPLGPMSAAINPGELVALIGPNGAGKSTLLKMIAALLNRQSGIIEVRGEDVQALPASRRAQLVAFVPQTLDTQFDLTAKEVVELGGLHRLTWRERLRLEGGAVAPQALRRIMEQTGTWELRDRSYATLSGGEAKRTLLAAALVQETPLLLLDEPTAHLDPGHAMKFLDLVRHRVDTANVAVLMAYHDLTTVGLYADKIWVIHEGQLLKTGTPQEVLLDPIIAQIYGVPLRPIEHPISHRPMLIFP